MLAGGGALPRLVAEAERRRGGEAFIVALAGAPGDWVEAFPHTPCGLGQVGKLFSALRNAGCERVCFAGGLTRPSLGSLLRAFDATALKVAVEVFRLMRKGDDGMLRGFAEIFERRGFRLVGASELLEDLLASPGALTRRGPSETDLADIARAAEIVAALGAVDVGQGAVVARGRCLAVETVQGTDAMLARLEGDTRRAGAPIPSGVIFKAPKPGQDMRFDVPAVGPDTVARAKAAGLNGVAVQVGGVFLLDPAETLEAADREGLFVYGYEAETRPTIADPEAPATARAP